MAGIESKGARPPARPGAPARPGSAGEEPWIEVIRKMDAVYADLVQSQVELERKNARLEETREFLDSLFASMSDILIVTDREGCVLRVNDAMLAQTALDPAAVVGAELASIFERDSLAALERARAQPSPGDVRAPVELCLRTADGARLKVSMSCSVRRDHHHRFAGLVLVGRVVDELVQAYRTLDDTRARLSQTQQQLLASEKMAALGRLVAGVAHELNNPISFVFGNTYALKGYTSALTRYAEACRDGMDATSLAELRGSLQIDRILSDMEPLMDGTLEGAERVRDIVQDLRRYSSAQPEEKSVFDLSRLVRTVVDWVCKTPRLRPVVQVEMPEQLEVEGFKGQVHQILVNLVQNAVDAFGDERQGTITIDCRRVGDVVTIRVLDDGPGIDDRHLDKLFEPFFTTKPIGAGTGLGLYVSYNMALKMGGDLCATNRPEGGAVFALRFPIR